MTTDKRPAAAELAILEAYDRDRHRRGHDYGGGQRVAELNRRRADVGAELERAAAIAAGVVDVAAVPPAAEPLTPRELVLAWDRVALPRIARVKRETFRLGGAGAARTLRAWADVERWVDELAREAASAERAS